MDICHLIHFEERRDYEDEELKSAGSEWRDWLKKGGQSLRLEGGVRSNWEKVNWGTRCLQFSKKGRN